MAATGLLRVPLLVVLMVVKGPSRLLQIEPGGLDHVFIVSSLRKLLLKSHYFRQFIIVTRYLNIFKLLAVEPSILDMLKYPDLRRNSAANSNLQAQLLSRYYLHFDRNSEGYLAIRGKKIIKIFRCRYPLRNVVSHNTHHVPVPAPLLSYRNAMLN